jgi:hypothetical protein
MLRQETAPSAANNGTGSSSHPLKEPDKPIVIDPSGGYVQAYQDWMEKLEKTQKVDISIPEKEVGPRHNPVAKKPLGGVSLTKVLTGTPLDGDGPAEVVIESSQIKQLVENGEIEYDGKKLRVDVDEASRTQLAAGQPALVIAREPDGGGYFMTQLKPEIETKNVTAQEVDMIIAKSELKVNGEVDGVKLNAETTHALLNGKPAIIALNGGSNKVIKLIPQKAESRPASTTMRVLDLATFLADPVVPGSEGELIKVALKPAEVRELRHDGATTVMVGKTTVTLHDSPPEVGTTQSKMRAANEGNYPNEPRDGDDEDPPKKGGGNNSGSGGVHGATSVTGEPVAPVVVAVIGPTVIAHVPPPPGTAQPAPPESQPAANPKTMALGLQVAVFMPWRQTWRLTGFSRGELRHSLALAPQEETTIEVTSWQRRARSLDQASSTEVDQSFESSSTDRETDDVFKEMTNRHDFNWQIEGSVDATYNAGWGSIHVNVGGGVNSASQLQQTARSTQERMKESTQKSAAKVRTMRSTRITDSVEAGSQDRVTRKIHNPNFSHTLTLDFFETLAHYEVKLEPVADRLGLVVLFPNPMATKEFTPGLVRSNEQALRRALLDGTLEDGFLACRKMEAYKQAKIIIADTANVAKTTDEATTKDRVEDKQDADSKAGKPIPQEITVVQLLTKISAAAKATAAGEVTEALHRINNDHPSYPVTADQRRRAQYWLFRRMLAKYLPGVLKALDDLPTNPKIDDAMAFVAALPPVGSAITISNLNEKSDVEKEDCGLGAQIVNIVGGFFKWGWSTSRCKQEGLYSVNDATIGGLSSELQRAYLEWQSKKSEGAAKEEVEVTIAKANANQDQLSTEDKLSMAFPLDELSSAVERQDALITHLNKHPEHYSFALFQALSPAEQNMHIERASGGALEVGMFEPRVIAINGSDLAVPLAPPPEGELRTMLEDLRASFTEAFEGTPEKPDNFIFPTPGLTINSRLGKCTATEEFIEESRKIELRRLAAEADSAEHEATRRAARIKEGDFDDPDVDGSPLHVTLDRPA